MHPNGHVGVLIGRKCLPGGNTGNTMDMLKLEPASAKWTDGCINRYTRAPEENLESRYNVQKQYCN